MARIRSIHPGLFTDESFVSCSPLARLLVLGLWTEADDQGVFEWKPVTLKMRLLPVDGADVSALLNEAVEQNICKRFERDGKSYGAIRNFRKYQKPKYPSNIHPLPDDLRSYVSIPPTGKVDEGEFPQNEGKPDQMERRGEESGGDNKDTGKPASLAGQPIDLVKAEGLCLSASGKASLGPFSPVGQFLTAGQISLDDLIQFIRARRADDFRSWKYLVPALTEHVKGAPSKSQGPPPVFIAKGSPEWDAWQAAEPGKHKAVQMKAGLGCYVATRFPDPATQCDGWEKGRAA